MTWEAWYTLAVIAVVFIALIRDWAPPDAVLFGSALLVGLAGIISPEEVFSGFVNQGTLSIAGLFIVAAALRETGALDLVGARMFGSARTERSGLLRMALPVAGMSAFLNNTPIVAMLMPVVSQWCRKHEISQSRLLMPLSFLSILGGACTLIGTSTNLVINGLMIDAAQAHPEYADHLESMWLFEMTAVGLPLAVVGFLYLFFIGPKLLPSRKDLRERIGAAPREYLADMQILPECRLVGQRVEAAGLRQLPGLFLIEIVRGEEIIAPVSPNELLEENDILTFSGLVNTIIDLERIQGLLPVADEGYEVRAAERRERSLSEAVISPRSPLVGKSIRGADFRARYNAAVVAVHRGGARLESRIGDIVLHAGDTLLLQTGPHFVRAHQNNPDFYLVSDIAETRPVRHDKMLISIGLLGVLVILMVTQIVPLVLAVYTVAGFMLVCRCLSATAARRSIDRETIFTIGAAFGLGHALQHSGAAAHIADLLVDTVGPWSPHALVLILYALTGLFASAISSKAAAVLMFPIALSVGISMGVSPRPLIMAVAFASAATFATPLGYPTNLIVYGPGGYKFSDFVRVGLPLNILLMALATLLIPWAWPF